MDRKELMPDTLDDVRIVEAPDSDYQTTAEPGKEVCDVG